MKKPTLTKRVEELETSTYCIKYIRDDIRKIEYELIGLIESFRFLSQNYNVLLRKITNIELMLDKRMFENKEEDEVPRNLPKQIVDSSDY